MHILFLTFTLLFFVPLESVNANELLKKLENKKKTQNQNESILKEIILDCKMENFTNNKGFYLRRDINNPETSDGYIHINLGQNYIISNLFPFNSYNDKVFAGRDEKKNFYLEMNSYEKNITLTAIVGYNVNIPYRGLRQKVFFEIDKYTLRMSQNAVEVIRDETQFNSVRFGKVGATSNYQCQYRNKKII
jgi:hypothetical protein